MRGAHRWTLLGLAALLVAAAPAVGAPARRTVAISVADFKIKSPKRLAAGAIRFEVENEGPSSHELIVVRLTRGPLPMRRDGLTVDEDALEPRIAGALEPEEPGHHTLDVRLRPGRYALLCNMAGHYLGGMQTTVVVR